MSATPLWVACVSFTLPLLTVDACFLQWRDEGMEGYRLKSPLLCPIQQPLQLQLSHSILFHLNEALHDCDNHCH